MDNICQVEFLLSIYDETESDYLDFFIMFDHMPQEIGTITIMKTDRTFVKEKWVLIKLPCRME